MTSIIQKQILTFVEGVKNLPGYEPSEQVNRFFSDLCGYVRSDFSGLNEEIEKTLTSSFASVSELQVICSLAEEKMEKYWAQKIVVSKDPRKILSDFTYYANYQKLTDLEYHLLLSQLSSVQKVLFVGSGALPVTAILLAKQGIKATLVERDDEAYDLSSQLITSLGLEGNIELVHSDFLDYASHEYFDVVWMASLLFTSGDAEKLLDHLNTYFSFDLTLIRTVEGMKQLLYHKIPLKLVKEYFTLELEVHPKNEILNSILLCSKLKK